MFSILNAMLGDAIRQRRQGLGLSMREAARRIGISTGYLVELEHGRNPTTGRAPMPSPTVLAGIGRALDVDLATLLDLAGVAPRRSTHMLLVQAGGGRRSARAAARRAATATVDTWIEIAGRGDPARALMSWADRPWPAAPTRRLAPPGAACTRPRTRPDTSGRDVVVVLPSSRGQHVVDEHRRALVALDGPTAIRSRLALAASGVGARLRVGEDQRRDPLGCRRSTAIAT